MNVLIIGGVAAGTKAAAKIKRLSPDAQVTILTKGRDISYAGCGLPYYVGGLIEHKEELIVNTPAKFTALTGANVLVEREVTALLPQTREAVAKNLRTGAEERYSFDECIIASGASSIVPPLPGVSLPGVFTIRTPQDAIDLREYLEQNNAKRAVVAGGGFIGLEMAENLMERGLSVTVIDMAEQIMPGFDPEMAEFAKNHLEKKGIKVRLNTRLEAVTGTTQAQGVQVAGEELKADVVVLSLGIRPNTAFLKESGIQLMPNGTIAVDAQLRTNLPHIYAAGDCVTVKNRLTGEDTWSPMGSSANMEGRTLALALGGEAVSYPGVLGTGVVKLPGLNGGRTGLTALTTGLLFLASMFIAPIAAIIPAAATSSALIYVGLLMLTGLKKVDFEDISQSLPAALMLIAMPISGSIGHGIGLGMIAYCVIKVFTGKARDVSVLTFGIAALFLVKFFLVV